MAQYEKKNKDKGPLTKGVATPSNGPFSELDDTNIERKHAKRYLSWACVVYPGESLPENWKSILGDLMIPWAMSPLHDQDTNADGEKKKAHRHLLLSFHSVKSYAQIQEITRRLGAPSPQPCRDTRGMVRYFLHLDNPEKSKYNRENIDCGGGFAIGVHLDCRERRCRSSGRGGTSRTASSSARRAIRRWRCSRTPCRCRGGRSRPRRGCA